MAELQKRQETAKRLMAYSAAAGLGAFGAAQGALEYAVSYMN